MGMLSVVRLAGARVGRCAKGASIALAFGSAAITGNPFDVPASGDVSMRGGVYYLNDAVDFVPAQDGSNTIAHLYESGDVSECKKA